MLIANALTSLVVAGLSVLNIGTIKEADGIVDRSFWLRNDGQEAVVLLQGYTSCGCTTVEFAKDQWLQPGDSTQVSLHFNPRGKGGEFYESATIGYSTAIDGPRQRVQMALEGECITSEETLMKQYPVKVAEGLRISRDTFNLGFMNLGQQKEVYVAVLHQSEHNRVESIPVKITIEGVEKGEQQLKQTLTITHNGKPQNITIKFDVIVK